MCGICAVVETDRPGQDIAEVLERMHSSLAHRGPDGEGHLWIDGSGNARALNGGAGGGFPVGPARAAAAFRWLKIQDLDARSNQPMCRSRE